MPPWPGIPFPEKRMVDRDRGNARLLDHLAAFERLTAREGGQAHARLQRELGRERAEFLLRALTVGPARSSESRRSAAGSSE
jgi:hypothetical protein